MNLGTNIRKKKRLFLGEKNIHKLGAEVVKNLKTLKLAIFLPPVVQLQAEPGDTVVSCGASEHLSLKKTLSFQLKTWEVFFEEF